MSESATPVTILVRYARPDGVAPRCGVCGVECHPLSVIGAVRCMRCQPHRSCSYGEPSAPVSRLETNRKNAAARAEKIRSRTRDRHQQEAMMAAERAYDEATRLIEEVFEPARSEAIIRRFEERTHAAPPPPIDPVAPSSVPTPITPRLDDGYVSLRDRWKSRVALERARVGAA